MTEVFFPIQVVFALRVTHFANSYTRRHVLQLTVAIHLAGQAIKGVVGEHQFDDILPEFLDIRRFGVNKHARLNQCVARGFGTPWAALLKGYFDTAYAAGAKGLQIGRIAKRGNAVFAKISAGKLQDGFTRLKNAGLVVDIGYGRAQV